MSSYNPAALAEGAVFHGRYQIVRCLAAGGMGAVYECVHGTTQKHRALKVMLPQMLAASGMRERFELEARVTARIESEHIVETFDAGVDEATGAPFLVMELLRGQDLDAIIKGHGPFTAQETVVLLSQAALALDKTHATGIVHRDLKPQNLFLTTRDDGSPRLKILDFGIAKVVADSTKTAQQTAAIGTPIYMAPEQTTGDGAIGPAADLYALGHIAYTLLAGEPYWMQEQQELPVYAFLSRMLAGLVERPTERAARRGVTLPAAFDDWFLRATARTPSSRFDRASTQIAELATVLGTPAPRLLLATPPAISQRLSTTPASVPPSESAVHAVSQPSAQASSQLRLSTSGTRARGSPTGGTMGPLAQDPIPAPPVSSRTPMTILAIVAAAAIAGGLFAVTRSFQSPSSGQAAAAPMTAAPAPTPAPQPPVVAPAATPSPMVEPAGTVSASPSASSTASAERPKKTSATPIPPPPAPTSAPPAKPTATPKNAPNCNPPFTVDASGAKHAKPECL